LISFPIDKQLLFTESDFQISAITAFPDWNSLDFESQRPLPRTYLRRIARFITSQRRLRLALALSITNGVPHKKGAENPKE
jgi:hypothetical protein